jgi:hydroxypyruvate reductase
LPSPSSEGRLRRDALAIFRASLVAADPQATVETELRRRKFEHYRRVWVVGAGKATATMAHGVERVLGKRIDGGLINVKDGHTARLKRIEQNECGHPVPDQRGVDGASRILEIAANAGPDDLVICLISGGASALTPMPVPPVTLEEKQAVTRLLLACGADIHELNTVRKHLSGFKGGQLARACAPAGVLTLILSDVVGDPLDVIGSGPTAPDRSTFGDACGVIDKYSLWPKLPKAAADRLHVSADETPKPGDPLFKRVENLIVGSNRLAVDAAAKKAKALGYRPLVLSTTIEGETRDVARMHAAILREIREHGRPVKPPACVISGGETTVTLKGDGLGGRNQEFALQCAIDLAGLPGVLAFSAGTDGTDGPTDAAGALAGGRTLERSRIDARAALARNDSYHFFEPLGDLVKTGPTGTNVMDVRLLLAR